MGTNVMNHLRSSLWPRLVVYPALAILVVLLIEGGAISPTRSYDVSLAAVYGMIVLSMSLLAGWGGVWSVGHPALVAIGAYTAVHGSAHGRYRDKPLISIGVFAAWVCAPRRAVAGGCAAIDRAG